MRTIPVAVLTGFLGAGKTSLLNSLLKSPMLADAAVVINEFGDVGVDHLLVEHSADNVLVMASGCLCCTIRGDLVDTLTDLLERRGAGTINAFNRIVIETTGLADPAPVLHSVMSEPRLMALCHLEGIITVVDAVNGGATLDAYPEAVKQVAVADRIVLTKLDLLSGREGEDTLFGIIARLRKLNPAARLLSTFRNEATAERLFNMGPFDTSSRPSNVRSWLAAEAYGQADRRHRHLDDISRHDDSIRSFCLVEKRAINPAGLEVFLELLSAYHGPNLLRMKGVVKVSDAPDRPVVVHAVQHIFHPPVRLDGWPDDDHRTRLVFIVKDIGRPVIEKLFRAFTDEITGGSDAFTDKTLSLNR